MTYTMIQAKRTQPWGLERRKTTCWTADEVAEVEAQYRAQGFDVWTVRRLVCGRIDQ